MRERKQCIDTKVGEMLAAYEMNLLDEGERRRFEDHLAACPGCLEELYETAPAARMLQSHPTRYRAMLDAAVGGATGAAATPGLLDRLFDALRDLMTPRVLVPIGAVAVFALVFMNYPVPGPDGTAGAPGLAIVEAAPWTSLDLRHAEDDSLAQRFARGMRHYEAGRYGEATDELSELRRVGAGEAPLLGYRCDFYLGVSYLMNDRAAEAIDPLRDATSAPLPPIAEGARWYLAQALLLVDDPAGAADALEMLTGSPVYGERAAAQLHRVHEICNNIER